MSASKRPTKKQLLAAKQAKSRKKFYEELAVVAKAHDAKYARTHDAKYARKAPAKNSVVIETARVNGKRMYYVSFRGAKIGPFTAPKINAALDMVGWTIKEAFEPGAKRTAVALKDHELVSFASVLEPFAKLRPQVPASEMPARSPKSPTRGSGDKDVRALYDPPLGKNEYAWSLMDHETRHDVVLSLNTNPGWHIVRVGAIDFGEWCDMQRMEGPMVAMLLRGGNDYLVLVPTVEGMLARDPVKRAQQMQQTRELWFRNADRPGFKPIVLPFHGLVLTYDGDAIE